MDNIYYTKGRKAKELVGLYKNPYPHGTYEWSEWRAGFNDGIQEPINFDIELEESTFFDDIEEHKIINYG